MLQHHLEIVCNQGYAVDDEEYEVGVRCIAVPVYDYRDKCVAAVGISGPTSRLTLDILPRITLAVQDIGKALSSRLSFKLGQV
jgi:DNA-binding IclR family transcriptional regulator